jgi:8-amino-7-oxononanoate synthase
MFDSPLHLLQAIEERKRKGLFRELNSQFKKIDFCSNDYLGFSKLGLVDFKVNELNWRSEQSGSTGSRLITGNSEFAEQLEKEIAVFHHAPSALLFNSGYDANLGLLSSVPQKDDLVLFDEFIHASLYDGIRLGYARHFKFRNNDVRHLEELILRHKNQFKTIYVVAESVYSMDGDEAPLMEIAALCELNKTFLIVDEAHAIGIFGEQGRGLCNELGIEDNCFARIYTYGKAMGCHGAAIVGSEALRNYLVNFSRPFIYTTALPHHSLACIKAAYVLLKETDAIKKLHQNISYFNSLKTTGFIKSRSAIHCIITSGNEQAEQLQDELGKHNLHVKAIKSPTVKKGKERIRICLHAFNSPAEINSLSDYIR